MKTEKVNIDFPKWMDEALEKKAKHLGIQKQELIKVWLGERLEKTNY